MPDIEPKKPQQIHPADMTDDDIEFIAEQRKQAFIFEIKQIRELAMRERAKAVKGA
jgi:hypothetical protein